MLTHSFPTLLSSDLRTFLTRLTRSSLWLERGGIRRAEVGFGGFEAWTEKVYEEEARNAQRLDTKLAQELHWLQRGVTARRRRNQGRRSEEHTSELQSLMRNSYAVF